MSSVQNIYFEMIALGNKIYQPITEVLKMETKSKQKRITILNDGVFIKGN